MASSPSSSNVGGRKLEAHPIQALSPASTAAGTSVRQLPLIQQSFPGHPFSFGGNIPISPAFFVVAVQRGDSLINITAMREYSLHHLVNYNRTNELFQPREIGFESLKLDLLKEILRKDKLLLSDEETLNGVIDSAWLQTLSDDIQLQDYVRICNYKFLQRAVIFVNQSGR